MPVECQGSRASVPASVVSGHILGSWGGGVNCVVHQMFVCRKTAAADGDGAILMLLQRR